MRMTPKVLVIGSLIVFWVSISIMGLFPALTLSEKPSDAWRPMSKLEEEGHGVYVSNGCSYCHSLYIRTIDWGHGAERISRKGDYVGQEPAILGSERTGPDLSEEGGLRSDDWHIAHFINPRYTSPESVMPSWQFLGPTDIKRLTAYIQYQGGTYGDKRKTRQSYWKHQALSAYGKGPDSNVTWLHSTVPEGWRNIPNPYPATEQSVKRGQRLYQEFCIGCHGPVGDGEGPAAQYLRPTPLNFTLLRGHLVQGKYIGGILYYQIMNGITGTGMMYFKKIMESDKIWDLSNYVAASFIGYTDSNIQPRGIDAALEDPDWQNNYLPPDSGHTIMKTLGAPDNFGQPSAK
ncbi:MAG TPA: cbb3-type cytochrome c oxidase subunit II [Ignavibacteriales bacterium]|nr:cbb3-type cytochrome c oxidase subunit II [Ignavibacteriales bacterium]